MRGINKVILCGTLGQDPELRTTPKGASLCRIGLATSRPVRRGEEWDEATDWHNIALWGKDAERCARLARKGSLVAIEGELRTDHWTDSAGAKRSKVVVHCRRVQFLGRRAVGGRSTSGPDEATTRAPERSHPAFEDKVQADAIPF